MGRTYIILTREVLVGQDMAQCIEETIPRARVVQFSTWQDLHRGLEDLGRVDTAFLDSTSLAKARDTTLAAVAALGARIILLGNDDSPDGVSGPGWRGLPIPFDTQMLRQRLT